MDDIIEELYYGEIHSFNECKISSKEYFQILKETAKLEEEIIEACPECRELLDRCFCAHGTLSAITAYERFKLGFKAGAQLMLEMLKPIE